MKPVKEGKVREIYDNGDSLIMVATDRISCFDVILHNDSDQQGCKVLTQMSKFWFDLTKDILPNHMITTDVKEMPEFFQTPEVRWQDDDVPEAEHDSARVHCSRLHHRKRLGKLQKERYCLWNYACRKVFRSPRNCLSRSSRRPPRLRSVTMMRTSLTSRALLTSRNISRARAEEYASKVRDYTIALYKKCADYALSRGIIIADTKFEFGLDEEGNIVIGDEMLTPDSSRFWPADGYEVGHSQPSFDKQFARDWLTSNPDNNWTLPDEIVQKTIDKYLQSYEMLTGEKLK